MSLTWPSDYNDTAALYECDPELARRPVRRDPAVLASMPYNEYLQSPEWAETRRQKALLANYRCERCHRRDGHNGLVRLNVHHRNYDRLGRENLDEDLELLCRDCHRQEHGLQ